MRREKWGEKSEARKVGYKVGREKWEKREKVGQREKWWEKSVVQSGVIKWGMKCEARKVGAQSRA